MFSDVVGTGHSLHFVCDLSLSLLFSLLYLLLYNSKGEIEGVTIIIAFWIKLELSNDNSIVDYFPKTWGRFLCHFISIKSNSVSNKIEQISI